MSSPLKSVSYLISLFMLVAIVVGLLVGPVEVAGGYRLLAIGFLGGAVLNVLQTIAEPNRGRLAGLPFGIAGWAVFAWAAQTGQPGLMYLLGIAILVVGMYFSIKGRLIVVGEQAAEEMEAEMKTIEEQLEESDEMYVESEVVEEDTDETVAEAGADADVGETEDTEAGDTETDEATDVADDDEL